MNNTPFSLSVSFPVKANIPNQPVNPPRATFTAPSKTLLIDQQGARHLADVFAHLALVLGGQSEDEGLQKTFNALNENCPQGSIISLPDDMDTVL